MTKPGEIKDKFQCWFGEILEKRRLHKAHQADTNVLFLTSDNEFSGIIYSLFRGRQTIFLTIFSTKFVVKCATKIFKIGSQKQKLCPKIFLNREFSTEKSPEGEIIIFPENLKNLNILS